MLPEKWASFEKQAESYLAQGAVGNIEFSGRTYQVQIRDPQTGEESWAFLQFDRKGSLKDRFCSCEEAVNGSACIHLATAYLSLFHHTEALLHVRFRQSLWNQLAFYYSEHFGDDPERIKAKGKDIFVYTDQAGKEVFVVKALTPEGVAKAEEIFFQWEEKTEETSLKFSGLSQEEISLWRQGRPSVQLRYELSIWNDLAKWLMLMQDREEKYEIRFEDFLENIPQKISIRFPSVEMNFSLQENILIAIIPSLSTVKSPLLVHTKPEETIQEVSFDKESGKLQITPKAFSSEQMRCVEEKGVAIDDWILVPGDGFYSRKKHPLLEKPILEGRDIAHALDAYYPLIKTMLKDTSVNKESVEISYAIDVDSDWNMHINGYLFEPGDLSKKYSWYFGEWAYLDGKGFFAIEGAVFDFSETVIPASEVGDFVLQNRVWLNQQEGYRIHITGIETKMIYTMIEGNRLIFERKAMVEDTSIQTREFGRWVYIPGQGFFPKISGQVGYQIRSNVSIKPDQIPLFIRAYKEDLELVPNFFSERSPVKKIGLRITVSEAGMVSIIPEYELYPEYCQRKVQYFEDFTYVEGEGFHRLPSQIQLPERFRYPIQLEKEDLPRFFSTEMDQLRDFALFIDPRLESPETLELIADELILEPAGYVLTLRYQSEKGSVEFPKLWEAVHQGERFLFSEIGLIDLKEDRFKWIRGIKENQVNAEGNSLKLSTLELLRLNAYDGLAVREGEHLLWELQEFRFPQEPDLSSLKSHLRSYQELGLKWLWFLYHHNLSGLLCDEMGLGKTHQAMALIAAIRSFEKEKKHFLIVCPTSVIYHWEEKLNEFLPGVRVCTFHGSKRSFQDFHKDYEILLTSYGIWRKEYPLLGEVAFEVAIFDEIQAAKNQASRIHASLLKVNARMRIGLTGTPIENRLRELKAVFDLILPNFMPSETEFRRFFVKPIEKEGNEERKHLLSRFIKPFLLRRKKENVLLDLPLKTEEISHCELSLDQKLLYTEVLHKVREGIIREMEAPGAPVPYLHVFSALSSLKQICNHPAAFLKNPESYKDYKSGKWNLFVELLVEALESGQKIVVFSQYLAMLDIIEEYLKENDVGYATIRGATVKRGEEIRRFNRDPSCEVFVGSLHAAGLGIDLTAASVVIHYDRWWNAAREDQATDRVHRIGQTRGVQVFKLVTKGTFEERIDEMIVRKGELMDEVVGVDDHRFIKHFDHDEILQLLKDL